MAASSGIVSPITFIDAEAAVRWKRTAIGSKSVRGGGEALDRALLDHLQLPD